MYKLTHLAVVKIRKLSVRKTVGIYRHAQNSKTRAVKRFYFGGFHPVIIVAVNRNKVFYFLAVKKYFVFVLLHSQLSFPFFFSRQLMILIINHPEKLEYIFAMVNRLKNIPGALEARNLQNESALLLACFYLPHVPFVARFIAEAVFEKTAARNEVCICGVNTSRCAYRIQAL
jgi:hypothetical protein